MKRTAHSDLSPDLELSTSTESCNTKRPLGGGGGTGGQESKCKVDVSQTKQRIGQNQPLEHGQNHARITEYRIYKRSTAPRYTLCLTFVHISLYLYCKQIVFSFLIAKKGNSGGSKGVLLFLFHMFTFLVYYFSLNEFFCSPFSLSCFFYHVLLLVFCRSTQHNLYVWKPDCKSD